MQLAARPKIKPPPEKRLRIVTIKNAMLATGAIAWLFMVIGFPGRRIGGGVWLNNGIIKSDPIFEKTLTTKTYGVRVWYWSGEIGRMRSLVVSFTFD